MQTIAQRTKNEIIGFLLALPIFSFYVYVYAHGILWDPIFNVKLEKINGVFEAFLAGSTPTIYLVFAPFFDEKYSFMYAFVLLTFMPVVALAWTSKLRIINFMGLVLFVLNPIFVCKSAGIEFHPIAAITSYFAPAIFLAFVVGMVGLQIINKIRSVLGV